MNRRGAHTMTILTLGLGLALFFIVVSQAGWSEVFARVRSLGAGFVLIVALGGLRVAARALAWRRCLHPSERAVGFRALFAARLAGDAAGQLFAAGPLIAEPARLAALGGRLTLAARVKSLAVETLTYTLSSCLLVFAGMAALVGWFALGDELRAASIAAALSMLIIVAVSAAVIARRWEVLSWIGELARRLLHMAGFSRRWKRQVAHLRTLEHHVFNFYRGHPADLAYVSACHMAFHLLGTVETWATLVFLGYEPTLLAAFTLEATNRAVNMIFSFVPGRVGVDEAGTGLLTEVLGLGAASGIVLAIVRKARILVWTAAGVAVYGYITARRTRT
ncbi:MAG: flippase-like domain-containing protein [Blastocatellales bacterium]|nr:flippase-like domain-containing protein [Blastocatellales bacterium]